MAEQLISPGVFVGPELAELVQDYWPDMDRTRRRAEASNKVIAGDDPFVLPDTFKIAGADQYIAEIPHPRTVPARVLQKVIANRPHLSIPLGPKGLGITAQRLTTRVEQPLNAICEDRAAGFQWARSCALLTYEGFCAGVTVLDPADWQKRPSPWEDEKSKTWQKRYRVDAAGRDEGSDGYDGTVDDSRARRRHQLDLDVFRARNIPIRHRAIGIRQCAPIFDGDYDKVGGLLISQEFSVSALKRKFAFGNAGQITATGGSNQDGNGNQNGTGRRGTLTLIEGWIYDEDGIPWVTYCVKGKHAVETRWKDGGEYAAINLKEQYGLDRLPVTWRFGLGNPGEINADFRGMGFTQPFEQAWRSVRAKLTANNVAIMFGGYPILIEESDGPGAMGGSMEDDEPNAPDIMPMKITKATPGTRIRVLEIQPVSDNAYRQIELELGAAESEAPGKSNKDQSGFSQSMAEAFEELAMTTVRTGLGELVEDHGSFVLEAGKRLPELGKQRSGTTYAPIMVFKSTDVPVGDDAGDAHNEPMELDPDLIDETFTTKAQYDESMSIPETQQAMEMVARKLMTRRTFLEKTGESSPENVELELMKEENLQDPEYKKMVLWPLVQQISGEEDVKNITQGQQEGLANDVGMVAGLAAGVAPVPGMPAPLQQGTPGVPEGGQSVTGMGAPQYGQNQLAGVVGGAGMTGPINTASQAGGVIPPGLAAPNGAM